MRFLTRANVLPCVSRVHPCLLVSLLYALSFGISLLNAGVFIDDWQLVHVVPHSALLVFLKNLGHAYIGYLHLWLLALPHATLWYRAITFSAYLLSAICLYHILGAIKEITPSERFWLTLFFAIFPVNTARIEIITMPYGVCYFLFFAGGWCLTAYIHARRIVFRLLLRILALGLFWGSFLTNSALVFYGLVPLYIAYVERQRGRTFFQMVRQIPRYLDFAVLPIVFWVIKSLWSSPSAFYTRYNVIQWKHVSRMLKTFLQIWYHSLARPICYAIELLLTNLDLWKIIGVIGILAAGSLFVLRRSDPPRSHASSRHDIVWLLFGLGLFVLAVVPYYAVGKIPELLPSKSRHQLFVPFGVALILVYGLKLVLHPRRRNLVQSGLATLFVLANFLIYLDYQTDWWKQLALMEQMKTSEILEHSTTFVFDDRTRNWNAMGRPYLFYEFTGMLHRVFGDETRAGIDVKDYCDNFGEFVSLRHQAEVLHISHYQKRDAEYRVIIRPGMYPTLTRTHAWDLLYQRITAPDVFYANLRNLLYLEYLPINKTRLQDLCK